MNLKHPIPLALLLLVSFPGARCALSADDSAPSAAGKAITAALQPFVDSHSLAGAVTLVADKERVRSLEAVGYADIAAGKPMTTDALFWIASQSKPITATALMMLVDEKKVKLDDPVKTYLPEFENLWLLADQHKGTLVLKRPAHPITVREILSHTSGLPFKSALEEPTLDLAPLRLGAKSYAMTPLLFEPGTKYQYSNAGINTAGRIIEVVSGMPYEEFLDKRLFQPLGMKDTTFWPNEEQIGRLAKSYQPNDARNDLVECKIDQLRYPLNDRTRQPMPAGGLFSTAADVARFCQMILNRGEYQGKRYVSEESVAEMTKRQTGKGIAENYGLAWGAGETFGHGGAHATNMTIDSKRGLIYIWMVQHHGFPGNGNDSQKAFMNAARKQFADAKE